MRTRKNRQFYFSFYSFLFTLTEKPKPTPVFRPKAKKGSVREFRNFLLHLLATHKSKFIQKTGCVSPFFYLIQLGARVTIRSLVSIVTLKLAKKSRPRRPSAPFRSASWAMIRSGPTLASSISTELTHTAST